MYSFLSLFFLSWVHFLGHWCFFPQMQRTGWHFFFMQFVEFFSPKDLHCRRPPCFKPQDAPLPQREKKGV